MLAGCSFGGQDNGGGTTEDSGTTEDGGGETTEGGGDFPPQVDYAPKFRFNTQPSNAQWNRYNTNNQPSYCWELMFSPLAWFSVKQNEFVPWLASDWEWVKDGDHLRLHLGDFWTWHNGDQFTAEDVVTKLRLEQHLGAIGDLVETVEAVDDYTVDVMTPRTIGNFLLELNLFTMAAPEFMSTPASVYGDMLEEIENTEPDTDARDEALAQVIEYQFQPPIGTGPFQHGENQSSRIVLEAYEDYPYEELQQQINETDEIEYTLPEWVTPSANHSQVHLSYFSGKSSMRQAWFTGNVDFGSPGLPEGPEVMEQFPSTFTMRPTPSYRGSCICFKLDHPVYGNREFRRALAYAMDTEAIASTTYGETGFANTSFSGMPRSLARQWLSDDFRNNTLTSYAAQDFEAAEAEMQALADRNSDFSKQDGTWRYQGDPITVSLTAPSIVTTHINAMRQLSSWLGQIGINAEVRGVEGTQVWTQTMPNGDYEVAQNYFGGAQPHPYFAYRNTWISGFLIGTTHNPPDTVTVPPIGESSGSMEVDLKGLLEEVSMPTEESRQKEIFRTLAWAWNQTLPYVSYAGRHNANSFNMANVHHAHPDDKMMYLQRSAYLQHAIGGVIARQNGISEYPYDTKYHAIEPTEIEGGLSLEESKSQVTARDESW